MIAMKNKTENNATQNDYFTMTLPVEETGIFRQGWHADEVATLDIVFKKLQNIENGTLAILILVGNKNVLLKRVYKNTHGYILEAPKNLDKPDEHIPPIFLTAKEARKRLTVLGKVIQFNITLK